MFRYLKSLDSTIKFIFFSIVFFSALLCSILIAEYFTLRKPVQLNYDAQTNTLSNIIIKKLNNLPEEQKEQNNIIKELLSYKESYPYVWYYIELYDKDIVFSTDEEGRRALQNRLPKEDKNVFTAYDGWYDRIYPIISEQDKIVGNIHLAFPVRKAIFSMHIASVTFAILSIFFIILLTLFFKYKIIHNVKKLRKASQQIIQGNYNVKVTYKKTNQHDVFYNTFKAFNMMSQKIEKNMSSLQQGQQLFMNLFYASKDAKILLDDNFKIYKANQTCLNFCNLETVDQLIGQDLSIFNFDDPEDFITKILLTKQDGKNIFSDDPNLKIHTKDGEVHSVQLIITKAVVDEKSFYLVMLHDVSQYYYHTARLHDSEMRIRAIIATAIDAIIILDQEGKVTEFNPAAEQIFNCYGEELINHDFAKLFIPDDLQDHFSHILSFYYENHQQEENPGSRNLMTMQDKNKKTFPAELTMTTFTQNDNIYLILFIRDISSRIESESMLLEARYNADRANQAKTKFLATVSHEIRTPLSGIIGILELLDDITYDQEQKKLLNHAQYNAHNLLTILNDLIDWSQADQDKLSLNPAPFDIKSLLLSTKNLMQPLTEQKNLPFLFEIEGDLPEVVYGDAGRIRQILLNLLSNAIKFTEKGYIQLLVKSEPSTKSDHVKIHITVKDTGFGISIEEQKILFRDFARSTHIKEKNIRGTGLGLAISQKLLDLMNSRIHLESEWEKGSTFSFTLDLKIVDSLDEKQAEKTPQKLILLPDEQMTVLIAEDVQTSQFILSKQLTDAGCKCYIAEDGEKALELTMQQKFNMIIMDIAMPKLTGILATQKIREDSNNINQKTPIIGISAHMGQSEKDECLAAGMTEFLTKPVSKNQLLSLVQRYISLKNNNDKVFVQPQTITNHAKDMHSWLKAIPIEVTGETLEQLSVDTSDAFIQQIFTSFIKDSAYFLEILQCATENQLVDPANYRAAHSLKGASFSLGLTGIGSLAKECEEAILQRDFKSFKQVLNEILIEHGKLKHYIEQQ